ncbi:ChuX/HutX family heme-like substrate-binding protein [Labrenzia sp. OB1]|uniref:ChuX/HutX family heme-like substrate-binding protein n=1 Tax=Labrenzia sp. OB1 TaxID=1561204 RepID=UPI0018FE1638|nr:ChuX/HutX family heme-like substrate-binding protein [Labrenzia sp. OB1]
MNKIVRGNEFGPKLVVSNKTGSRGSAAGRSHCELADLYLSAGRRARGLDEGVDLLKDWLPGFERAIASTANDCAVMSEIGVYQMPMIFGEELKFDNSGIATRLLPAGIETLVAVEADVSRKEAPSLQIFDLEGRTVHKCHIASLSDQLAFDVLMYGTREKELANSLPGPFFSFLSETLKPAGQLPAQDFSQLGVSENLDACLLNQGKSRYERLKKMGRSEAWTIDRQVVPHVLRYFSELRQPLTVCVPSTTCMQLKSGRLDDVIRHGDLIELTAESNRTFFDPAAIGEFWIVRSRHSLSLECYSKSGTCVLVFVQDRPAESLFNQSWMEILKSLNPATRANRLKTGNRT